MMPVGFYYVYRIQDVRKTNRKPMLFFPNCKINIGLDVLSRRRDGFHDISTVMMPVRGLCDVLEIVPSGKLSLEFTQSGGAAGPLDENLCVRAWNLMAERYGLPGACIHLHKIIPTGAGLGGGSSDAAFTLKGLNKIFSLGLTDRELESIAAELGSDTAFFIRNETCLASGRGEILEPYMLDLSGLRLVIVKPDISVSTAEAYAGITPHIPATPLAERISAGIREWRGTVTNAFEPHIFARHPEIGRVKQRLFDGGAVYASMSGSGSAVYGFFPAETPITEPFIHQQLVD